MFSEYFAFFWRLLLVGDDLKTFKKKLGLRIKDLRLKKKLTQPGLASKLDVDFQTISRIENGRINPSAFYLKQLCEALEVDMNSLFDFSKIDLE